MGARHAGEAVGEFRRRAGAGVPRGQRREVHGAEPGGGRARVRTGRRARDVVLHERFHDVPGRRLRTVRAGPHPARVAAPEDRAPAAARVEPGEQPGEDVREVRDRVPYPGLPELIDTEGRLSHHACPAPCCVLWCGRKHPPCYAPATRAFRGATEWRPGREGPARARGVVALHRTGARGSGGSRSDLRGVPGRVPRAGFRLPAVAEHGGPRRAARHGAAVAGQESPATSGGHDEESQRMTQQDGTAWVGLSLPGLDWLLVLGLLLATAVVCVAVPLRIEMSRSHGGGAGDDAPVRSGHED
ncbi:hypothetical protein SSBG_03066 [Streptomyces sp. SPB074]|nr:hypothetical protein SSBG_03066 [Streptomyces sp. SPB074]